MMPGHVLAVAIAAQRRIARGLFRSQQVERRQVILEMGQPQLALQRGDVARRLGQA